MVKNALSTWLLAIRAITFPLSALPVIAGVVAVVPLPDVQWGLLVLTVLAVVLMHASGNLFNEYFDFRSGVDKPEADSGRFCGVLPGALLRPKQVLIAGGLCSVVSGTLALWLVHAGGPLALVFGAIGFFGLYAYTGPPFLLKHRGLGEPLIFVVYGPALMLGAACVQTGGFEFRTMLASFPVGLLITDVLLVNNIRDYREDKEAGIRTLVGKMGLSAAKNLYVSLILLANVALATFVLSGVFSTFALLPFAASFLAVPLVKQAARGSDFSRMDLATVRYTAVFCLLFILGLLLDCYKTC